MTETETDNDNRNNIESEYYLHRKSNNIHGNGNSSKRIPIASTESESDVPNNSTQKSSNSNGNGSGIVFRGSGGRGGTRANTIGRYYGGEEEGDDGEDYTDESGSYVPLSSNAPPTANITGEEELSAKLASLQAFLKKRKK